MSLFDGDSHTETMRHKARRALADLHVNYENVPTDESVQVCGAGSTQFRVQTVDIVNELPKPKFE